ncbi:MAG: hypothetical protein QOG94_228 [Solirubrobacteraceae bacterium]|jgi:hypothetical protein|nr:hypothetical protein [Solirubrobacteraceae bacterium]MEA2137108.1 hypothetical protein [Solirubrobacteraceae bacterium]
MPRLPSREIHHAIELDASPEAAWAVLTDTPAYGEWNPFITRLTGELRVGAKLAALVLPPGDRRPATFKQTVLAVEPPRELRWLARVLVPGLFDGDHSFKIEPIAGGRTRFTQAERISGVVVPLVGGRIDKTLLGMQQMNEAFKRRVEGR